MGDFTVAMCTSFVQCMLKVSICQVLLQRAICQNAPVLDVMYVSDKMVILSHVRFKYLSFCLDTSNNDKWSD